MPGAESFLLLRYCTVRIDSRKKWKENKHGSDKQNIETQKSKFLKIASVWF